MYLDPGSCTISTTLASSAATNNASVSTNKYLWQPQQKRSHLFTTLEQKLFTGKGHKREP